MTAPADNASGPGAGFPAPSRNARDQEWYKNAVLYQVYLRTFQDGNGDGLGDFPGLMRRLDYLKSIGVDGLYINPFYVSPADSKDGGYDIVNHTAISPEFGGLGAFRDLTAALREKGLTLMIDLVLSHTSVEAPEFEASRDPAHPEHAKYRDWYVWADGRAPGEPPNNWASFMGGPEGSAWQYDGLRGQWYLRNFAESQADLNLWNPEVQQFNLDIVEFWAKQGVDGLRLDACGHFFHNLSLKDNPLRPQEWDFPDGMFPGCVAADYQFTYNINQPESPLYMERIRQVADRYGAVLLAEVPAAQDSLALGRDYVDQPDGTKRCHMAYTGRTLRPHEPFGAKLAHEIVTAIADKYGDGRHCTVFSNHDFGRILGRQQKAEAGLTGTFARTAVAFYTGLPGTTWLYQGDELDLGEANVPYEKMKDPVGLTLYPITGGREKGRDGCRTPMPWDDAAPLNAGFTAEDVEPYLPVDPRHLALAVTRQEADPDSALNQTRAWLHWRRGQPAFDGGTFADRTQAFAAPGVVAYSRTAAAQSLTGVFNLSGAPQAVPAPAVAAALDGAAPRVAYAAPGAGLDADGALTLLAWSFAFLEKPAAPGLSR